MAEYAVQTAGHADGDIQHGHDLEGGQVAARELARTRIGVRVVRDDRLAGRQRLKISGIVLRVQRDAGAVAVLVRS